MGFLRS